MATSKRQDILSALEAKLVALSLLNTVALNEHIPQELNASALPAAFIFSGPDRFAEEQASGESETPVWDIEIVCLTSSLIVGEVSDIENVVAEVHRVVVADTRLNDQVDRIYRIGSDPDRSFDLSGLKTSNSLRYQVIYEQTRGQI